LGYDGCFDVGRGSHADSRIGRTYIRTVRDLARQDAFAWSGMGSYLVVILLAAGGILVLGRHTRWMPKFKLGQVLALEGLTFSILALLAVLGGRSVERVEAGKDGGIVGWGLVEMIDTALPHPLAPFF